MKKYILSFLAGTFMTSALPANAKTLVTYFTLTGNTEKAAKIIQKETSADIYQIELVTPYPSEYREQTELAKQQMKDNVLPEIKPLPANIEEYDVVFVGSPVWWGTMSTPVRTFLASGALKGKTVFPFVTHGGGGASNSFSDTAELCKDCNVDQDGWSGYEGLTFGLKKWAKNSLEKTAKNEE